MIIAFLEVESAIFVYTYRVSLKGTTEEVFDQNIIGYYKDSAKKGRIVNINSTVFKGFFPSVNISIETLDNL